MCGSHFLPLPMTDSASGASRAGVCREAAEQFSRLSSQVICVQALALPPSSSVTLASHWTSLSLSCLIWRMGINIVPLRSSNLCSLQAWHIVVWSKWRYCCWFRAEAQLPNGHSLLAAAHMVRALIHELSFPRLLQEAT